MANRTNLSRERPPDIGYNIAVSRKQYFPPYSPIPNPRSAPLEDARSTCGLASRSSQGKQKWSYAGCPSRGNKRRSSAFPLFFPVLLIYIKKANSCRKPTRTTPSALDRRYTLWGFWRGTTTTTTANNIITSCAETNNREHRHG